MPEPIDALLVLSFGGPERREEVMPFLRGIVGPRVPQERLEPIAEHYYALGGKSPINEHNRTLVTALQSELAHRGLPQRVYLGNRHWDPFLADTVEVMKADGVRRAAVFVTSAFGSFPGCRAYLSALDDTEGVAFDKLRLFFHHPTFLAILADHLREATKGLDAWRLVFTAHSIPRSMAATSPYVDQLMEACGMVAEDVGKADWDLVYQSRSGPPSVPWLEPDVCDFVRGVDVEGGPLVVVPIGFVSAHMEVIWDLDHEAAGLARERGIEYVRPAAPQEDPRFAGLVVDLLEERLDPSKPRPARGCAAPWPDRCAADCCPPPSR